MRQTVPVQAGTRIITGILVIMVDTMGVAMGLATVVTSVAAAPAPGPSASPSGRWIANV
jgi:hypothetical protein